MAEDIGNIRKTSRKNGQTETDTIFYEKIGGIEKFYCLKTGKYNKLNHLLDYIISIETAFCTLQINLY